MKTVPYKDFERRFLENAYKNAIPVNVAFELTPLCNLNCRMCYVHLQDASLQSRLLSGEQWIAIMDEAIEKGMISALLTGGEALTHPDFWKIYRHLTDAGIGVTIKSNGLLLNPEAIRRFCDVPPATLDVSVYGCDDNSYEAVTGCRVFETVDRNLRAALEADLPVRLMITPSACMLPYVERIMKYAGSFGVETRVNVYLGEPYDNTGRKKEDFDLTVDQVIAIQELSGKILPDARAVTLDDDEETGERVKPEGAGGLDSLRCAAGRTRFGVSWQGMMKPCLQFPEEIISADILELGVKQAWEKIHREVIAYRVPEECGACEYLEECVYCPIKHGKAAREHRCNPAACELDKRLINERKRKETEEHEG